MSRTVRRAAFGAALLTVAGSLVAFAGTSDAAAAAAGCAFFDDFAYSSRTDPAFTANGWTARGEAGGPGVPGATWSADNITFPTVDGQKAAQLAAATDGTAAGTVQAEFHQVQQRFFNGTYASRIKFQDTPVSGTDGDHVNETYFTIGPAQRYNYDPLYSELDFSEYLPNGGWGVTGSINYQTSWNGYQEDPWAPHNAHSQQAGSINGWHTVVGQVGGGHVKYFIDGVQVGDHTVDDQTGTFPVYPRVPMTLNYNLWFIDTAGHTSGTSTYQEAVDWTYYVKDTTVAPADMTAQAAAYRSAGTTHTDTLGSATCPTAPPPTTPTTTRPTTPPTIPPTTPPTSGPPANCANAQEWSWSTVYLAGQRVKHNGHLWQANWWTQGSEPGLTAQWRDLGAC
jgi:carbohydrate binding protein with CBM5/12 domain